MLHVIAKAIQTRSASPFAYLLSSSRVLELGGGMTALAGIGLALLRDSCTDRFSNNNGKSGGSDQFHGNEVNGEISDSGVVMVVTDGHPSCVTNQQVCIEMNNKRPAGGSVSARLLKWQRGDPDRQLRSICEDVLTLEPMTNCCPLNVFDAIIAADCLFFKDFHDDLIWVLAAALRNGGKAFLLQPSRSGSMHIFLGLVQASGYFEDPCIFDDYDDQVSAMHAQYMQESMAKAVDGEADRKALFDPDIHYPVLIVLTRGDKEI